MIIAGALVAVGAASVSMADTVIASGAASGAGIRALSAATYAGSATHDFGYGNTSQFATFTGSTFSAAQNAVGPSTLSGLPGGWLNSGNAAGSWSSSNAARDTIMNNSGARWIGSPNNQSGSSGDSVLFAIPFYSDSAVSTTLTLTFASDNSLGSSPTIQNNIGAGFQNAGVFLNGTNLPIAAVGGGSSQPNLYTSLQQEVLTVNLNAGLNWLYLHQFNSGGPGGSGFTINFAGNNVSLVPLPTAVWSGLAGLVGVGGVVVARRRRMA